MRPEIKKLLCCMGLAIGACVDVVRIACAMYARGDQFNMGVVKALSTLSDDYAAQVRERIARL